MTEPHETIRKRHVIQPEQVAAILLAAGRGRRFGADKLRQPLQGHALGQHAAQALAALPFGLRIAVTADGGISYDARDFHTVINPDPAAGQSSSIRLGLAEAMKHGARAILIALADMPFVPVEHFSGLLSRYRDDDSLIASFSGHAGPPVLFGQNWFSLLAKLEGDRGAGTCLAQAEKLPGKPEWFRDIDTPGDLVEGFHAG